MTPIEMIDVIMFDKAYPADREVSRLYEDVARLPTKYTGINAINTKCPAA